MNTDHKWNSKTVVAVYPVIDREWLFKAFCTGDCVSINGYQGYISSIQREDGSGKKYIITFHNGNNTFVRTN